MLAWAKKLIIKYAQGGVSTCKEAQSAERKSACCEPAVSCCPDALRDMDNEYSKDDDYVIDRVQTDSGEVPKVSCILNFKDVLGFWKARWGINRMNYKVAPGLYCVGNADRESPVIVSANYKMSFDIVRRELKGLDAWIVVLDTKGINVWCAAGKGTFGTEELVKRLAEVNLARVVSHRRIIVPQLGAPGVVAHEVFAQSGFEVVYGPVRAKDIPAFLAAGLKATPAMRKVNFTFLDRIVLTPIELMIAIKPVMFFLLALFALRFVGLDLISFTKLYPYIGAVFIGCVLVPALLPWIPGRAFSWKGWLAGAVWVIAVGAINRIYLPELFTWQIMCIYFLTVPAVSSYLALNYTGCSTYTSLSGVLRETKLALPVIGGSFLLGLVFGLVGLYIHI